MYNQLLYFIIALLIFSIQQPGTQASLPPVQAFLIGAGIFIFYVLICYSVLRGLSLASWTDLPRSTLSIRYHRIQARLSILALGTFAAYVYVLNIKFYFSVVPGFEQSLAISGLTGLGLYLTHLLVIWLLSHPIYKRIHNSSITRMTFLRGQLGFSLAILIPWLMISILSDIVQMIEFPAFLDSDIWQLIFFALTLGLFVLFAPRLVVRLWGCETLPESPLRAELDRFCRQQGFSVGDFKLWPIFGGEVLTAGIMGILPGWRYILITRGLLEVLHVEELKAVVAHEMGHVRRYHLLLFIFFFLCYSVLTYSLHDITLLFFLKHAMFLDWALTDDSLQLSLFSLLYSLPVLILLVIYFRFIFGFFLRNSERQADLYALQVVGHPFTLISSLEKIALFSGHIHDLPSWHHYSIRQRMNFLLDAHRDPSVARKHNAKLYGTALVFIVAVAGLIFGSLNLKDTRLAQHWRTELEMRLVERQIQKQPHNAGLFAAYGGLLLELGRHKEAESSLRKALAIDPEDTTTLNNLAWLYATAPPPYSDPRASLTLALKAATRSQEPHVLDTLAEAFYVNNRYPEALEAITKALQKNPENRDYFLRQKQKIEDALGREG